MSIDNFSIQNPLLDQMNQLRRESGIEPAVLVAGDDQVNFTEVFKSALTRVSHAQNEAARMMSAVETGLSDDLVGAMIASQKAGLGFAALVQVRNRLVSGFEEIMRMPI